MPATLTPLRYPGGKTKYTKLFIDVISTNNLRGCTFVEVFAGGAGAAISLLLKGYVKALFLNDIDIAIYAFWKSVKDSPENLIRLIHNTKITMEEWRKQKEIYTDRDVSDLLSLGFSTFFLNRCNHSGILEAGPVGGLEQKGKYTIVSRFNKATSIAKIEAIAERADSIKIFNLDGLDFLKVLNRKHRNRKLLIYLDPPYYQKGPGLYLNHFQHEDHESLRDYVLRSPFPWVLSYDNNKNIVGMYQDRDCKLYINNLRHTISGNTNAQELIISKLRLPSTNCYDLPKAGAIHG